MKKKKSEMTKEAIETIKEAIANNKCKKIETIKKEKQRIRDYMNILCVTENLIFGEL